jgi:sugar phosphate isomerase/epimerase
MNRRTFLKASAVTVATSTLAFGASDSNEDKAKGLALVDDRTPKKAEQKLSSQEGRIPGRTMEEKIENLIKFGGVGYELPAQFDPEKVLKAIKGTPVKISAVCAADGPYIVADKAQRRKAVDNAKEILTRAGAVGSTGVIMVPAFNGAKGELCGREGHVVLIDLLKELGEHAVKSNCRMMMEPLDRNEAWFLLQLSYAARICKEVNSPGIAMMGDMYHMNIEETSDRGAFISGGQYVHHVHLASTQRNLPGQDERSFVDGFRGLKEIGYNDYMSLECGCIGDPMVEIPKSFKFLKEQWDQAVV